jgi:hypothetical protein
MKERERERETADELCESAAAAFSPLWTNNKHDQQTKLEQILTLLEADEGKFDSKIVLYTF